MRGLLYNLIKSVFSAHPAILSGGYPILRAQFSLRDDIYTSIIHRILSNTSGPTYDLIKLLLSGSRVCPLISKYLNCWQKLPIMLARTCENVPALQMWVINHTHRSKPFSVSEMGWRRAIREWTEILPWAALRGGWKPWFLILCTQRQAVCM